MELNKAQRVVVILFIFATLWNGWGYERFVTTAIYNYANRDGIYDFFVREVVIGLVAGAAWLIIPKKRA